MSPIPPRLVLLSETEREECLVREAQILGHAEAVGKDKRALAARLIKRGWLTLRGTMSNGGLWYGLGEAAPEYLPGARLRLVQAGLEAVTADDLHRVASGVRTVGEIGVLAFEHPDEATRPGWFFVEVTNDAGRRLYVPVAPRHVERVGGGA